MVEQVRKCAVLVAAAFAIVVSSSQPHVGWAQDAEPAPPDPQQAGQVAAPHEMPPISRADVDAQWAEAMKVRQGDNLEGVQAMTEFAARFPDTDYARQALFQAGAALQAQRLWPEAVAVLTDLVNRYPGHDLCDDAMQQVASILQSQKEYEQAAAAWIAFQRRYPRHPAAQQALLNAGSVLQQEKDNAGALAAYQALVDAYPNGDLCDDALWAMAQLHVNEINTRLTEEGSATLEDLAEPTRLYQLLIERFPYSDLCDNAAFQLAMIQYSPARQYHKAEELFEEFMRRYPGSDLVPTARIYVNTSLSALQQAARYDTKEKLPTIADALRPVERLRGLKEWGQAIALYQEILREFAGNDQCDVLVMQIGECQEEAGDLAAAIKTWRSIVEGFPGSELRGACQWKIVTALQKAKDTEGALLAQTDYVNLFPNGPYVTQCWTDILNHHRTARDIPALLASLKRVYTEFADLDLADDALFEAACLHHQLRQYSEAALLYADLLKRFPGSDLAADATFLLGRCQHEMGDLKNAVATYRRVVAEYPNSGLADDAIGEMRALENPAELARLRLYTEGPVPTEPPAGAEPQEWQKYADAAEPLLEGLSGPIATFPGAHSPLHLRFKLERQAPATLEVKWLTSELGFMNLQVRFNGKPVLKAFAKPGEVTRVTVPATETQVGQNTFTLVALDTGLHWDYLSIASSGLPAEKQGGILLGKADDSAQEFAAGANQATPPFLTELFLDLDQQQWATRLDPEYEAFKAVVAEVGKEGAPQTAAEVYETAYNTACAYYARRFDLQAAKLLAMLQREPLPNELRFRVQGLWALTCESACDYGLEEIWRGNLVIAASPQVTVQLRQYNVPDFYHRVFDALREGGPGPRPQDPPFVISCGVHGRTAAPMLARFAPAWRTTPAQWASLVPAMVQAWANDPGHVHTLSQLHPVLPAAYAALATLHVEARCLQPNWDEQARNQFIARRQALLAAAKTVEVIDAAKLPPEAVAGWLLRLALGPEGVAEGADPINLAWEKLGPLLNTLRTLPQSVLDEHSQPAERSAIIAWAAAQHLGQAAVPDLKNIGVVADEQTLAKVDAALNKALSADATGT